MSFVVEKVSEMVFISCKDSDMVVQAWDASEFTERKLKNAMKHISKNHCGNASFEIRI